MKKCFALVILIIFLYANTEAQSVAINTDGSVADVSAILDLKSSAKGLLIPRMTEAQKIVLGNPAKGLMIYQTDATEGHYYNAGTPLVPNWLKLTTDKTSIAFSATSSVAQSFSSAGYIKVQYPTEEYDESGNFVPGATSEFTVPASGIYNFNVIGGISAPPNVLNYVAVFLNNVQKKTSFIQSPSSNVSLQLNTDMKLIAGDVIDIRFFLSGGGTQFGGSPILILFSGRKVN